MSLLMRQIYIYEQTRYQWRAVSLIVHCYFEEWIPEQRFLCLSKCKQVDGGEGMMNIDDEVPKERTAEMGNRAMSIRF